MIFLKIKMANTNTTITTTAPNTPNNSLLGSVFQALADYFNDKQ